MEQIDEKLIERMKKLLALASNNDNEHQAQAAMAKLQEMLEAHNLELADLGKSGKGAQRRSDTKKTGGLYGWQRKLWKEVAELNFCYYFSIKGLAKGSVYEHRLVGSHVNVVSTELMATYLQQTVERLAQQWAKDNFYKSVFVREAIAYREGMADRIAGRLRDRRYEIVEEAKRKEEERKRDEARAGMAPTGNALTILSVISSEADFNNDYLQGWEMGTTAANRAAQEARHAAWMAARAARTPEQIAAEAAENARLMKLWAAEDAKRQKRRNKTPPKPRYRAQTAEEARRDLSSYSDGYRKGADVGLDTQVDNQKARRIG